MTLAQSADFHQMAIEVETSTPGTFTRICGLTSRTFSTTLETEESRVPDCDDESLPSQILVDAGAVRYSISGTGVWAKQNHKIMRDWIDLAQRKNIRVFYGNVNEGDPEYVGGIALLTQLDHSVEKGQKVQAEIAITFAGAVTRTAAEEE